MIERIDLDEEMSKYNSSDVLLLKRASELIAEKLNEVIDAVNDLKNDNWLEDRQNIIMRRIDRKMKKIND